VRFLGGGFTRVFNIRITSLIRIYSLVPIVSLYQGLTARISSKPVVLFCNRYYSLFLKKLAGITNLGFFRSGSREGFESIFNIYISYAPSHI
jgi:hypothetical protein